MELSIQTLGKIGMKTENGACGCGCGVLGHKYHFLKWSHINVKLQIIE